MLRGSTIHVLSWMQLVGGIYHKVIGLREGKNGVNKGGSRLINAHECLEEPFNVCKRDGMEGETLILVRNS